MNGTLIVAEHLRGELRELTRELVDGGRSRSAGRSRSR